MRTLVHPLNKLTMLVHGHQKNMKSMITHNMKNNVRNCCMNRLKFFRILWRFNVVVMSLTYLILAVVLIISLMNNHTGYQSSSVYFPDDDLESSDINEKWEFGKTIKIDGTDTLVIPVLSTQKLPKKETTATRNYLFVNPDHNSSFWLFDKNTFVIHEFSTITKNGVGEYTHAKPVCLYFIIYKTDTNSDQAIKTSDKASVALSKLDGTGYTEIEHNIDTIHSSVVIHEGSQLVLFYRKEANFYISKYNLNDFKKIAEQQIPTNEIAIERRTW